MNGKEMSKVKEEPRGLRFALTEKNCGGCVHFKERDNLATYGQCELYDHKVKPEWVCNSVELKQDD